MRPGLLGELNSFARLVSNIDLFIQLHMTTKAVVSSRIEGTQTNIDEALLPEEDVAPGRRQDWQEVRNYTRALNAAISSLDDLSHKANIPAEKNKPVQEIHRPGK